MKNGKMEDERILLETRKIQSQAYIGIVYILIISIIVQQFLLKAPFAQYAVEFYILIGCGMYQMISDYKKGIAIDALAGASTKKIWLRALLAGGGSVIFLGFLSGMEIHNLAVYFMFFVAIFFLVHLLIRAFYRKKQTIIDKQLDDDF